ncbi:MAG: VPLPA-CTERM sorting domain-containing protein [Gammaproteobacteria bacterium]
MRISSSWLPVISLTLAGLASAGDASAVTISFLSGPANAGNWGNSLTFSNGGISVSASAYAETGTESPASSGWYFFQTAQIYRWSTGLGICNRNEGLASSTCSDTEHEVDTVSRDDLLVFVFDQTVNFQGITVDPYNSSGSDPNDRDVTYWVGNLASMPALTTRTFNTLGTMPTFSQTASPATSGFDPLTHVLTGTGNVLLVSGDYTNRNCKNADVTTNSECEAYKIRDISVTAVTNVVPVPAAAWLFGSAVALLGVARRRR